MKKTIAIRASERDNHSDVLGFEFKLILLRMIITIEIIVEIISNQFNADDKFVTNLYSLSCGTFLVIFWVFIIIVAGFRSIPNIRF